MTLDIPNGAYCLFTLNLSPYCRYNVVIEIITNHNTLFILVKLIEIFVQYFSYCTLNIAVCTKNSIFMLMTCSMHRMFAFVIALQDGKAAFQKFPAK